MVDTHSSGQGVFGNMCCGDHMFSAPNLAQSEHYQKQYDILPMLVTSKGHCVKELPKLPFVVEDKIEAMKKSRKLFSFLRKLRPDICKRSVPLSKWELAKAKWEGIIISYVVNLASSLMKTTAANWMVWNLLLVGMWDISAFRLDAPFTSQVICMALGIKMPPS